MINFGFYGRYAARELRSPRPRPDVARAAADLVAAAADGHRQPGALAGCRRPVQSLPGVLGPLSARQPS